MSSDRDEIVQGLKMAAVAVVSATVVAAMVIGAGVTWQSRTTETQPSRDQALLIRTSG